MRLYTRLLMLEEPHVPVVAGLQALRILSYALTRITMETRFANAALILVSLTFYGHVELSSGIFS